MTTELSTHLSEEALDDVLIGLGTPESEAHLAVCGVCRGQLEEFHSKLQMFSQASLAWSEARPAKSFHTVTRLKHRHAMNASLGWALAATIFLLIGVPVWNHRHDSLPNFDLSTASAREDSAAQIAQDNDLLRSVNMALSATEASPLSEYNLSNGPHSHLKQRPELRNR
jgi:predicted anti-sigma-YlaC factor YlaD